MVVHPASHGIPRVPRYSRTEAEPAVDRLRDSHPLRSPLPAAFGWTAGCSLRGGPAAPPLRPYNPGLASAAACATSPVWAAPGSLAATTGMLSLPRGSEMFQFPRFPPPGLSIQPRVIRYEPDRVAPFGDPRITACPRLPEAYRRLATSFIGPRRQGIHRVPYLRKSPSVRSRKGSPGPGTAQGLPAQMLGLLSLARLLMYCASGFTNRGTRRWRDGASHQLKCSSYEPGYSWLGRGDSTQGVDRDGALRLAASAGASHAVTPAPQHPPG